MIDTVIFGILVIELVAIIIAYLVVLDGRDRTIVSRDILKKELIEVKENTSDQIKELIEDNENLKKAFVEWQHNKLQIMELNDDLTDELEEVKADNIHLVKQLSFIKEVIDGVAGNDTRI